MRALLTVAASAAAILPAPALAVDLHKPALVANPATSVQHGVRISRGRGDDGALLVYDRTYQGDSAWRSDSSNDWWHDRPERAYPRWMVGNQNCDRMWWGGGAWRC